MPEISDHLRGPWRAVLADNYGYAMDGLDGLNPDDEVFISIRRGAALPVESDDDEPRLPGTYQAGDVIELWNHLYVEDGDPSTDAPARWAQAQAMADGLNGDPERMRNMIRSAIALTKSTDGNALNPDEKIPVGELQRVLHVDAGCSIETNQFGVPS